eukprot:m.39716 g.39716  ORF g.39716 m.39716 type:complete len:1027 (-) comp5850_c0_seq1:179-3259(-)
MDSRALSPQTPTSLSSREHDKSASKHDALVRVQVVPTLGICPSPRESASMCWTPDGALLFGGYSGDVQATMAELWLLDFDTTEWQPILPSDGSADHSDSTDGGTDLACHPPARSGHAAAMVYDNIMICFGGISRSRFLNDTWTLHRPTRTWTQLELAQSPEPRHSAAACAVHGTMYLYGGSGHAGRLFDDLWMLVDSAITWTQVDVGGQSVPRPLACSDHALVRWGDNILLVGGRVANPESGQPIWMYNTSFDKWEVLDETPVHRARHAACVLNDAALLIVGGCRASPLDFAEPPVAVLDLRDMRWVTLHLDELDIYDSPSKRVSASDNFYDFNGHAWVSPGSTAQRNDFSLVPVGPASAWIWGGRGSTGYCEPATWMIELTQRSCATLDGGDSLRTSPLLHDGDAVSPPTFEGLHSSLQHSLQSLDAGSDGSRDTLVAGEHDDEGAFGSDDIARTVSTAMGGGGGSGNGSVFENLASAAARLDNSVRGRAGRDAALLPTGTTGASPTDQEHRAGLRAVEGGGGRAPLLSDDSENDVDLQGAESMLLATSLQGSKDDRDDDEDSMDSPASRNYLTLDDLGLRDGDNTTPQRGDASTVTSGTSSLETLPDLALPSRSGGGGMTSSSVGRSGSATPGRSPLGRSKAQSRGHDNDSSHNTTTSIMDDDRNATVKGVPFSDSLTSFKSAADSGGSGGGGSDSHATLKGEGVGSTASQPPHDSGSLGDATTGSITGHNALLWRRMSSTIEQDGGHAVEEDEVKPGEWASGELLGRGAFGSVFKCMDRTTGSIFAGKRLNFAHLKEEDMRSLVKELRTLRRLSHPHIVSYRGYDASKTELWIFMDFCAGGDLHQSLKSFGGLTATLASRYTYQILLGLGYLHDNNVLHRDIKGANILLTVAGQAKLSDFGLAAMLATESGKSSMFAGSEVVGSPYWMAPEVITGKGSKTASDIWSLGCTVYEMANIMPPNADMEPMAALFHVGSNRAMPTPPASLGMDGSDFVQQCFNHDPVERPNCATLLQHSFVSRHAST